MSNHYPVKLLKSLWQSLKQSFASNEEIRKATGKYPRVVIFCKARFDRTKFTGLPLTVLGLIFLYILLLFLGAVEGFITSDLVVSADVRLSALLYAFRNILVVKTFIWVTLLGESPTIIVFGLIVSALLYLSYQKWQIVTLWITIIGSESFTFLSKIIFHRPRPAGAVLLEGSASFPSGHATIAVAFYGFLIYLSWRSLKKKKYHFLAVFAGVLIILAIGFSRLYLGVHYVSDVWVGYLIGLLWLILGISITEWELFKKRNEDKVQKYAIRQMAGVVKISLICLALVFYIIYGVSYRPQLTLKMPAGLLSVVTSPAEVFSNYNLPRYTETIIGKTQEPVSFIIIAKNEASLLADFKKAGWSLADAVGIQSTASLFKSVILNKDYPTAPMTPSFWNKRVHDFGFEKSTDTKSARQRHHARFWKTNLQTEQRENIYVGTVSLDTGVKWLITHQISPDVDTEREGLFVDLQKIGVVKSYSKIKMVDHVLGQNFTGNQFFTDGEAYVVNLRNE